MHCIPFSDFGALSDESQLRAGGKGRSLAALTSKGFRVPPGFVLIEDAFHVFLSESRIRDKVDLLLAELSAERVESTSNALVQLVLSSPIPDRLAMEITSAFQSLHRPLVAVRSSASVEDGRMLAWAGLFDSFLNCSADNLLRSVKQCWASLYSPRTLSYAREQRVDFRGVSMAIVVQAMVASEVSGTAFSRHPVTKDEDQIVLESAFGLGEAVVSGAVTPDKYVYSKSSGNLLDIKISMKERMLSLGTDGKNEWRYLMRREGKKASLSPDEATELAELVSAIEVSYGHTVDVEWAREGSDWYILQSRPITA